MVNSSQFVSEFFPLVNHLLGSVRIEMMNTCFLFIMVDKPACQFLDALASLESMWEVKDITGVVIFFEGR